MYKLFEVTGIELEYMIVDQETLQVMPIADKVLFTKSDGKSDVFNGPIDWSNELVSHVIEIKTHEPAGDLDGLHQLFHHDVLEINNLLEPHGAKLLPTGSHPLMNPYRETVLWPHEYSEIYTLYNSIFGCKGHGWSNVQSMHINLPFDGDEEFARLHAGIRLVLPLIPSLCASTPILEGKLTGYADTRLEYYRTNQIKIPSITGKVIPEQAFSKQAYYELIFNPIMHDIKPYDTKGILDHHFLNSRGAIARFDRGAIEIRLIDLQEAPLADLAIAEFLIEILKNLCNEKWSDLKSQQAIHQDELSKLFLQSIVRGDSAFIDIPELLGCFGVQQSTIDSVSFWEKLANELDLSSDAEKVIEHILNYGILSTRVFTSTGNAPTESKIKDVYMELSNCLHDNRLFK